MIHSIVQGDGPPVVLIHGLDSSLHDWDYLVPALNARGFRTWAIDLPGHGDSQSPADPGFYSSGDFYRVTYQWFCDLPEKQPIALVGHSLGGYIALQFALDHPERVEALVLFAPLFDMRYVSTFLRLSERLPGLNALNMLAVRLVPASVIQFFLGFGPIDPDHLSAAARRQTALDFKRATPHALRVLAPVVDLSPSLGKIAAPALVVWGDKDQTLQPASFPLLVSGLQHAQGYPVRGGGHQLHLGRTELVSQLATGFIQEHVARAALETVEPLAQTSTAGAQHGS